MPLRENRQVRLVARPRAIPQAEHFSLVTEPVTAPVKGEILIQNRYLSVDPAQRGWANDEGNYSAPVPLNTPMRALAVGEILESNASAFRTGEFVYGWFGWQRYCVATPDAVLRRVVPSALPLSANLSVLGMNGITAYLALHGLGDPKPGEHVLVSTAAGSVGSFVGQLASITGCRAVGLTGSTEKVALAKSRYGYQEMINYREAADLGAAIRAACPDGNDIFFDNTGGPIADCRHPNHAAARTRDPVRHGRECVLDTRSHWSAPRAGDSDAAPQVGRLHHLRSCRGIRNSGSTAHPARARRQDRSRRGDPAGSGTCPRRNRPALPRREPRQADR